jgi:hypothetical protein
VQFPLPLNTTLHLPHVPYSNFTLTYTKHLLSTLHFTFALTRTPPLHALVLVHVHLRTHFHFHFHHFHFHFHCHFHLHFYTTLNTFLPAPIQVDCDVLAPSCGKSTNNTHYTNGDINRDQKAFQIYAESMDTCVAICSADTECTHFTYVISQAWIFVDFCGAPVCMHHTSRYIVFKHVSS